MRNHLFLQRKFSRKVRGSSRLRQRDLSEGRYPATGDRDGHPDDARKYVRPDQPFGPPDAAVVAEPECAARLFDWNNNVFAEMLSGSDVFIGRRGSGKSSLLRSFQARNYLLRQITNETEVARAFRDRHHISAKILQRVPKVVIDVDTPEEVNRLHVQQHLP